VVQRAHEHGQIDRRVGERQLLRPADEVTGTAPVVVVHGGGELLV
jgi:hypothetical protein